MVQAVLDALSAPQGGGDLRTRPQRYHDALEEAMRRLLASDVLPKRAGQPVKALVHIYFAWLEGDAARAIARSLLGKGLNGPSLPLDVGQTDDIPMHLRRLVVLHQLGWTLTAHPDGTSEVTSPAGKTIRSHSPPPRPG